MVRAFDRIADSNRDVVLVLGGQVGWGLEEVEATLGRARHPDRIIRTGYLPDPAVPALLRTASVVACPALAEGFGLPALEAMACGAPLVTTEGTAMAEMAGAAAWQVVPNDAASLGEALETVLEHGPASIEVDERRALGLKLAATHTWDASAALHLEAYRIARTRSH